jgi:hypothetical protein
VEGAGLRPGHDGVRSALSTSIVKPDAGTNYRCISMIRSIGIMLWFM